jgi:hypothetical protein
LTSLRDQVIELVMKERSSKTPQNVEKGRAAQESIDASGSDSLVPPYKCIAKNNTAEGHIQLKFLPDNGVWLGDCENTSLSVDGMLSFSQLKQEYFYKTDAGAKTEGAEPVVLPMSIKPEGFLVECKACEMENEMGNHSYPLQTVMSEFYHDSMSKMVSASVIGITEASTDIARS